MLFHNLTQLLRNAHISCALMLNETGVSEEPGSSGPQLCHQVAVSLMGFQFSEY